MTAFALNVYEETPLVPSGHHRCFHGNIIFECEMLQYGTSSGIMGMVLCHSSRDVPTMIGFVFAQTLSMERMVAA